MNIVTRKLSKVDFEKAIQSLIWTHDCLSDNFSTYDKIPPTHFYWGHIPDRLIKRIKHLPDFLDKARYTNTHALLTNEFGALGPIRLLVNDNNMHIVINYSCDSDDIQRANSITIQVLTPTHRG